MIEWKTEPLPIHGSRIVDINGNEIVRDVYEQQYAEQIVREHNAIAFAINNGAGWIFEKTGGTGDVITLLHLSSHYLKHRSGSDFYLLWK